MEFESAQSNTTAKLPILKLDGNPLGYMYSRQTAQEEWYFVTRDVNRLLQKIVSRLAILGVVITQEEILNCQNFLRSLPHLSEDLEQRNFMKIDSGDSNGDVIVAEPLCISMINPVKVFQLSQMGIAPLHGKTCRAPRVTKEDGVDSKGYNDKLATKTCLKNYERMIEEQLITYRRNDGSLDVEEVEVLKGSHWKKYRIKGERMVKPDNRMIQDLLDSGASRITSDLNSAQLLWHRRLGHINFKNINKLVKDNLVRGLPTKRFENDQTCVACLKGKQHRASWSEVVRRFYEQSQLYEIHLDVMDEDGPHNESVEKDKSEDDSSPKEVNATGQHVNTASPEVILVLLNIILLESISGIYSLPWVEAMQEELLQFKLQQVWKLMDLPNGKRAIGTKWVFRNKKGKRGIMIRNKERICKDPTYPDKVYHGGGQMATLWVVHRSRCMKAALRRKDGDAVDVDVISIDL
ncbi:putative ribonuclease H-like domain-containing protein [Tanacetum coccineum]